MPDFLKDNPFPQIKKIGGLGREMEDLQRAIAAGTRDARKNPENKGRRINGVTMPASPATVTINHKLGRTPEGIRVVEARDAACSFHVVSKNTRRIVIQSDGAAQSVADFWVF